MKSKLLLSFVICALASCSGNVNNTETDPAIVMSRSAGDISTYNARQYVDRNIYIDVNPDSLYNAYVNPLKESFTVPSDLFIDQYARLQAAEYRFNMNCKINGRFITTDLKSGEDINVSPRVFDYLINRLKSSNEFAQKSIDEGFSVQEMTQELFNRQCELTLDQNPFDKESVLDFTEAVEKAVLESMGLNTEG